MLLLVCFAAFATGVIALPLLLAGFPHELSSNIADARTLVETGIVANAKMRMTIAVFGALHPFIEWRNLVGWSAANIAFFTLALIPWWLAARRLFDARVAWVSTVILSALPLYWEEAYSIGGYPLGLLFLFTGFWFFLAWREKHRLAAVIAMGLCLGAAVASRDAFITFLPWFVGGYAWHSRRRPLHAAGMAAAFCIAAYVAFTLPLLPNALRPGMTPLDRLKILVIPAGSGIGEGHVYPDQYTYDFLREEFNERKRRMVEEASFLVRQQDANYRSIFGISRLGFFGSIGNGVWLFLNALPSFTFQETLGGAFLWLFIVPGGLVLWRTRRTLLLHIVGLWLSMEFVVRFVLHFGRAHLNDVGWAVPLLAAVGVVFVADALQNKSSRLRSGSVATFIVCVVALQLLQADRKLLALRYSRSNVPAVYAATEALKAAPSNAVVAHPRRGELFFFSPQTPVTLHPNTIDWLAETGRLREPFARYGVTAIMGYSPEQTKKILAAVPGLQIIPLPDKPPAVELSTLTRYLLNLTR